MTKRRMRQDPRNQKTSMSLSVMHYIQTDLEEFSQGFVIHSIGAIEDDTLFGNCFGQIFGCFSLQIHNERLVCYWCCRKQVDVLFRFQLDLQVHHPDVDAEQRREY